MSEPVLSVLFFWHQHQPYYKDPLANRYDMPWVPLHATKDYYDMVALLEEFPKIRANFNLVPSLLKQLDDYAVPGRAHDRFLSIAAKPAKDLSLEERLFLLQNFFMANWENMIDPYPRYRELLDKRGRSALPQEYGRIQQYFKEQDIRDLQVWFNLAWCDPLWREKDDLIRSLYDKGGNFTEEEKQALLAKQSWICSQVVPKYKELAEKGQIELTSTPFYHPILPLVCDTDVARIAMPQVFLPGRYRHPEDAALQIQRAITDHQTRFGAPPRGMWPSEGSVSPETARLFIQAGVNWIATDEGVLARSIDRFYREDIYEPYRYEIDGKSINFFFRDHELSDAIGFIYGSWDPAEAAANLIHRLHVLRKRLKERDAANPRPHVVPIILDGENCWEYYRRDGLPFLRELYKRLSEDPYLQTVRASDYLQQFPAARNLSSLWSGSWINNNFGVWIGHPEDNRAWDSLQRTRNFLSDFIDQNPNLRDSPDVATAWEEIMIAEGSDWCWWYGDDHSSANDEMFDYLFRKHLMNVYTLLGAKIPDDLFIAIKGKKARAEIKEPIDFITPKIDGKVSSYYEWQAAGIYETEAGATGTMHRAQNMLKTLYFGFDLKNLYFRLDMPRLATDENIENLTIKLSFLKPEKHQVQILFDPSKQPHLFLLNPNQPTLTANAENPAVAYTKVLELAIPISYFTDTSQGFEVVVSIERQGLEQERWPLSATIRIPVPTEDSFVTNWTL
jgi:alpha-amylase/alpha-mannosidase (GH57 family)